MNSLQKAVSFLLGGFVFLCQRHFSIREFYLRKVFFYNSGWVISILKACFEITHVFLKSKSKGICSWKPERFSFDEAFLVGDINSDSCIERSR